MFSCLLEILCVRACARVCVRVCVCVCLLHAMADAKWGPSPADTGCPNAPFNIVYWRRNFGHTVSLFERPVIVQMSTATDAQICKTCFGNTCFQVHTSHAHAFDYVHGYVTDTTGMPLLHQLCCGLNLSVACNILVHISAVRAVLLGFCIHTCNRHTNSHHNSGRHARAAVHIFAVGRRTCALQVTCMAAYNLDSRQLGSHCVCVLQELTLEHATRIACVAAFKQDRVDCF